MKITIENTDQLVVIEKDGVVIPARVWEGKSERGTSVICLITQIAVPKGEDQSQFQEELREQKAPTVEASDVFDLRLVL